MSEIKLTGVITQCLAMQQGTSRTGKSWSKQEYVIEHEGGQYPRRCCFAVMGERIDRFAIHQGEVVTVYLDIDAHDFNGRWYNDITAWKVEREQAQQPAQAPYVAPEPSYAQGGVVYPEQQQQAVTATPTEPGLPF